MIERESNNESIRYKIDEESRDHLLQHTKTAFEIAKTVTGRKTPVFLYGGTVRNLLLNIDTSAPDFDFIGDFNLDEIEDTNPHHVIGRWDSVATIRLRIGSGIYDFTATKDIEARLAENDITISNLCMSENGELYDYFDALESLVKKEIKIIA